MEQISPDLAKKVLTANIRNVVQKVQDGKTLTEAEIKNFESHVIARDGLLKARQESLLKKWIRGGRLTDEEKAEIGDIIEVGEEPRGRKRGKYQREQKDYAELFGTSDRTIKRWVKTGKNTGVLPPLDDPAAMPAWWAAHYKQRVPECIVAAANAAAPATAPAPDTIPDSPPKEAVSARTDSIIGLGTGFGEMLERVRGAEREAYIEYHVALRGGDESRLTLTRKTWGELSRQLRELERDAHDILSRSGSLIEKSLVEKLIAEIHAPIINGIRSMWRRVRERMMTTVESQQDRVWQEEVDRLFFRLSDSGFTRDE